MTPAHVATATPVPAATSNCDKNNIGKFIAKAIGEEFENGSAPVDITDHKSLKRAAIVIDGKQPSAMNTRTAWNNPGSIIKPNSDQKIKPNSSVTPNTPNLTPKTRNIYGDKLETKYITNKKGEENKVEMYHMDEDAKFSELPEYKKAVEEDRDCDFFHCPITTPHKACRPGCWLYFFRDYNSIQLCLSHACDCGKFHEGTPKNAAIPLHDRYWAGQEGVYSKLCYTFGTTHNKVYSYEDRIGFITNYIKNILREEGFTSKFSVRVIDKVPQVFVYDN